MFQRNDTNTDKLAIWFSSILRWILGLVFVITGYNYREDGGWILMIFGIVIVVSGFFRPRRCIDDGCNK
jgi:hypothetical protein